MCKAIDDMRKEAYEEGYKEGYKEGREEVRKMEYKKYALNMSKYGYQIDFIAKCLGIDTKEVTKLINDKSL